MFPSIKMEGYMEPELSIIVWVKMVTKNIVLGSTGTHFMHMRVNNVLLTAWANLKLYSKNFSKSLLFMFRALKFYHLVYKEKLVGECAPPHFGPLLDKMWLMVSITCLWRLHIMNRPRSIIWRSTKLKNDTTKQIHLRWVLNHQSLKLKKF